MENAAHVIHNLGSSFNWPYNCSLCVYMKKRHIMLHIMLIIDQSCFIKQLYFHKYFFFMSKRHGKMMPILSPNTQIYGKLFFSPDVQTTNISSNSR